MNNGDTRHVFAIQTRRGASAYSYAQRYTRCVASQPIFRIRVAPARCCNLVVRSWRKWHCVILLLCFAHTTCKHSNTCSHVCAHACTGVYTQTNKIFDTFCTRQCQLQTKVGTTLYNRSLDLGNVATFHLSSRYLVPGRPLELTLDECPPYARMRHSPTMMSEDRQANRHTRVSARTSACPKPANDRPDSKA
jgi:hypothetical protein